MALGDFAGTWKVGSSGRNDFPKGDYYIYVAGDTWTLKTSSGEFGIQTQKGYDGVRNMIHCTLKIKQAEYHFEAVLGKNKCNDKAVIYGHLFPTGCPEDGREPVGEGATGGWSAEKQGDPPPPW